MKWTNKKLEILDWMLEDDPSLSIKELAYKFKVSTSNMQREIRKLGYYSGWVKIKE